MAAVPGSDALAAARAKGRLVIAVAGNPNVGKSTIFNSLTGLGVETAHYPGKTVQLHIGETSHGARQVTMVDLPGIYDLSGLSEDQQVARRLLLEVRPDVVVHVADANNLGRNLFMTLQLIDLALPVVLALNLHDEARRGGVRVDAEKLWRRLGVPVIPTVATEGLGLDYMLQQAIEVAGSPPAEPHAYGRHLESAITRVSDACAHLRERPFGLPCRSLALLLLSADEGTADAVGRIAAGEDVLKEVAVAASVLRVARMEPAATTIARERHGLAGVIADDVVTVRPERRGRRTLRALAVSPVTGVPILLLMLAGVFGFLFFAGERMSTAFSAFWEALVSPAITGAVQAVAGTGAVARTLLWGLDAGAEASLAIGIPYILTFYFLLALLEDSGYLNSVAFLADRTMHRFGLHGRAVVPLVAAAGCNVPAILATRSLASDRERVIASTLITMVPCSARTAVVLGAVSHYIGAGPALGVFCVVGLVNVGTGLALDRILPGHSSGLVMEMFPFRRPSLRSVAAKAWDRFKEFLTIATPIVVVGSVILGGLYETGWLWTLTKPFEWLVVGWLGLPAVAGLTLLLGFLRKELSLQLLIALGIATFGAGAARLTTFMSPTDLFVYALVNTLALPCVSTCAVLGKELGWGRGAVVIAGVTSIALLLGGVFARLLPLMGVTG